MEKDQQEAIKIVAGISVALLILVGLLVFILPEATGIMHESLEPGLGLKDAAVIAFALTVVIFIVFAVVAGDGLIGELQFMIGGFSGFFVFLWLMLAWVF